MRHGYYVDGRRYSFEHRAQAIARACWLASQYGRTVEIKRVDRDGSTYTDHRVQPCGMAGAAA